MPLSERPPKDDGDEVEGEPKSENGEHLGARRVLERIIREGVKRAVEKGVEQITETPDNLRQYLADLKLPKEAAHLVFQQVDETKNGLYRVVAKEIRDFLEHTNFAEEMTRVLTTLSFEIKTEIRFIPNDAKPDADGKLPKPDVKASVRIKDS